VVLYNNWSQAFLAFFSHGIFLDSICQGLRHSDSLNKVLVHLPISICAEEAKPSLGAFPYFIRLDTNVNHFTAWLRSPKISRFFTSFWQWKAGRRVFNWTYITKPLHLSLLYVGMKNWLQILQSCTQSKVHYMTQRTTLSLSLVACFTFIIYVIIFLNSKHALHTRIYLALSLLTCLILRWILCVHFFLINIFLVTRTAVWTDHSHFSENSSFNISVE